jgi:hypothetical protein
MEISLNTTEIQKSLDQFKNATATSIFDSITGQIKGALENSGASIQNTAIPIAKQDASDDINPPIEWGKYLVYGGLVMLAVYAFKNRSKLARA